MAARGREPCPTTEPSFSITALVTVWFWRSGGMKDSTRNCRYCGAQFVASRPDTQYCSRACRQRGYRARVLALNDKRDHGAHQCARCGKPLESKRSTAKFCSVACRQGAYRERAHGHAPEKTPYFKTCEHCGNQFEAKMPQAKYCSPLCRQMAWRGRSTDYKKKARDWARRRYHDDDEHRKAVLELQMKRYRTDPEYRSDLLRRQSGYILKRYNSDPKFKVDLNISSQIRQSLRGGKRGQSWETLVGYTLAELVRHLESQFATGMCWENYGEWHIDHRVPRSWFDYKDTDDPKFKQCWALSNLQPKWAAENRAKGNKFTD